VTWRFSIYILLLAGLPAALFAQQRSELDSLRMEYSATKILQKSENLIAEEQYTRALRELIDLVDYYPQFSRLDVAFLRIGQCLTSIRLYDAAKKIYTYLIRTYPKSPVIPYALAGLERVSYLEGNYDLAIDYLALLREKFPEFYDDEIYYYGGQSFLYLNRFDEAISAFNAIREDSEYWGYALYSRAQAYLKKKTLMKPSGTSSASFSYPDCTNAGFFYRNGPNWFLV